jgi:sulfate transport system ATP-binding protein
MSITIRNVSKRFGKFVALDNVSLDVPDGALLALLGPSGSGKTTLLRIIAGLEIADSGTVLHREEDITHHSARDRNVGFVFQHYALFKHMTVEENIGYGLKVRKRPKAEVKDRVAELLQLIRLEGLASRYPSQLSGGQRQRVALARALAARPRMLLLDEPFGALDAKVRQELRHWLRRLHEEIHVTSIFVTHDQEEAFEVADQVVVMNEGKIVQVGSPNDVYEHPANPFVFNFLGRVVTFQGRVRKGRLILGDAIYEVPEHGAVPDSPATVYVRPQDIRVASTASNLPTIRAVVRRVNRAGPYIYLDLERQLDGTAFEIGVPSEQGQSLDLQPGATLHLSFSRFKAFLHDQPAGEVSTDQPLPDAAQIRGVA